jgi:small subunit ribosomal protein S16
VAGRRAQLKYVQEQKPVAVKIRLLRMGKIRNPQYRIVVANSRTKRDGKAIEFIGVYQPKLEPSLIEVNSERAQYWLSVGAQPSQPVQRLLEKTGDWQKFKGLPAPPPLLVAGVKADRKALYEAEAKTAMGLAPAPEAKPAKKAAKAAEAPKAEAAKAEAAPEAPVEAPAPVEATTTTEDAASADASAEV